ncbi:MAG: transcriptional repressor [Lachnospiraceae bacterium]|nr:transcriptional repressor [Lachnospiraceae bacterium]
MKRPKSYKTKQRESILNYIASLAEKHITAAEIAAHFKNADMIIGRTTIYRHLDKMTESGVLRRYTTDGVSGACYQYTPHRDECREHLHLKCESCSELIHLDCEMLKDINRHVLYEHDFRINALKTVLYGTCTECISSK